MNGMLHRERTETSMRVDAVRPCPLAQVAYLINQRDHRFRVPPQAQRWKAQSGPREANRPDAEQGFAAKNCILSAYFDAGGAFP